MEGRAPVEGSAFVGRGKIVGHMKFPPFILRIVWEIWLLAENERVGYLRIE